VVGAGKIGHVYVHDRKDCSLIRFSEARRRRTCGRRSHLRARVCYRVCLWIASPAAADPRLGRPTRQYSSADDVSRRKHALSRGQAMDGRRGRQSQARRSPAT
jgi:hypothetical protein